MQKKLLSVLFMSLAILLGHSASGRASTMNILYSFCSVPTYCQDGLEPLSALLPDGAGGFYATVAGGTRNGGGGVVHLVETAGVWNVEVLYSFCPTEACTGGSDPQAGVIKDVAGNLYGVTDYHGTNNAGTAFELVPNASHTKWTLKILHRFCSTANCLDGFSPRGLAYVGQSSGAAYDGTSALYGTA